MNYNEQNQQNNLNSFIKNEYNNSNHNLNVN